MGSRCLLKARSTGGEYPSGFFDLKHCITLSVETNLSSLIDDDDLVLLREGREFWLEINNAGQRHLLLSYLPDEDGWDAILEYENGDAESIFDVTLESLLIDPSGRSGHKRAGLADLISEAR